MKYTDVDGNSKEIRAVWIENDLPNVYFIDQRFIPFKVEILVSKSVETTAKFISDMVIRGAPSIGAAGAYGILQSVYINNGDIEKINNDALVLKKSRPTAIDLNNVISILLDIIIKSKANFENIFIAVNQIINDIISECSQLAEIGQTLLKDGYNILHHCHTGALATVDIGTALGVIIQSYKNGIDLHVYVDETRPRLQGGRITAWELMQENVPHTLISDSVAGSLMKDGKIDIILVGADRVAMNGDFANKIGTYSLAVLAKYHNIPFFSVIPWSTFDQTMSSGMEIPIEERSSEEVVKALTNDLIKKEITNKSPVYNPAFDITPNSLVTGFITPTKIIYPPFKLNITRELKNVSKKNK